MLYFSDDYDFIHVAYDDNSNIIAYECIYRINGTRYVDVWEHAPADWP